jgi:hypothetical protein
MAKISVITPTNSVHWYRQAKRSLLWQTLADWEWIVLWNGGAFEESDDPRIKCVVSQVGLASVGALKREACTHVSSPYCVEFDHDDELDRECLGKVLKAFEETGKVFVFSDGAHVRLDGTAVAYGPDYGWTQKRMLFHGEKPEMLLVNERPLLLPQNVSRIWFAPDHVRAWEMEAYVRVNGHQSALSVCDDQDLMMRLWNYSGGDFHHIHECLYKSLNHGQNTQTVRNAEIQKLTVELHDAGIESMALAWARKQGLEAIDLGGGISKPNGWKSCDTHDSDIIANLDGTWPFVEGSVGVFRAHHVIEHLSDPIHTMNEAWRCLCHGGLFLIEVPSTDGRGAFQDPTHRSFWNQNSASYFAGHRAKYIRHAGYKGRFQVIRNLTHTDEKWMKDEKIPCCRIHLAAIKGGARLHGLVDMDS